MLGNGSRPRVPCRSSGRVASASVGTPEVPESERFNSAADYRSRGSLNLAPQP